MHVCVCGGGGGREGVFACARILCQPPTCYRLTQPPCRGLMTLLPPFVLLPAVLTGTPVGHAQKMTVM